MQEFTLPIELLELMEDGLTDADLKQEYEECKNIPDKNIRYEALGNLLLENYRRIYNKQHGTQYTLKELIELNNWQPNDINKYRTRATSKANTTTPKALAIPTLSNFQYATSLYQSGNAYVQPMDPDKVRNLTFKEGAMYFKGALQELSEAQIIDMQTKEGIMEIDMPLLRSFYSIILADFEKNGYKELKEVITLNVPDLAEYMGMRRNLGKQEIDKLVAKVESFHNMVGVIKHKINGKVKNSRFPVLTPGGYDATTNDISFSSPYLNYLIKSVYGNSIRKDKNGKAKLKKNGNYQLQASNSYLVNGTIYGATSNKAAIENVCIIVAGIEQAGRDSYHISARTLIERNPQLKERLENSKNPVQLLNRVFTKTWDLLKTQTRLNEAYIDIKLPKKDSNGKYDPRFMPTPKTLDTTVFEFKHKGKRQQNTDD